MKMICFNFDRWFFDFFFWVENLQGVAGFPVVDAAAEFEMEEEKEKSKCDQKPLSFDSKLKNQSNDDIILI